MGKYLAMKTRYLLDSVLDLFRYRFPTAISNRELYFQYVARNRCVLAFSLGLILGLVF